MNYKRDLRRVEQTIRDARFAAWGQKMEPLQGKRKVGFFLERELHVRLIFTYRLKSTLGVALVKPRMATLFPEKCLIWS